MNKYKPKKSSKPKIEILQPNVSNKRKERTIEWEIPEYHIDITLKMFIQRLLVSLLKPMSAIKFKLTQLYKRIFKGMDIPWFKLGFLAILSFVMLKKDLQFNLAFKSPLSMIVAHDDDEQGTNSNAQTISWKGSNGNLAAPVSATDLNTKRTYDFIKQFSEIAVTEMQKYGVPASIKMAQALIESRAGTSTLAVKNNNHFGMKCFSKNCKKGHCTNLTDDHHKDFFRSYPSSWESWRAHSELISQGRYRKLKYNGLDYKKWAYGLKEAGYATDKRYAEKLIGVIDKYKLYKLDEVK